MSKVQGIQKSVILEASIFEDGFSVGHIDANVLEAIGGDDYEQLESAGTIDAQVRLVPPEMFAFTLVFTGSRNTTLLCVSVQLIVVSV